MAVIVETAEGPFVLAGDAIATRENLKPLPERRLPFHMIGLYMDFAAAWRSLESIMQAAGGDDTRVLGVHDPEALAKKIYP